MPIALAVDFNSAVSASDQQTFDQILEPVMKVYNFVKYAATVVAVLFLVLLVLPSLLVVMIRLRESLRKLWRHIS